MLLKYCCHKSFSLYIFKDDLTENLINDCNSYDDFDHIFSCQLDKDASRKKKWIRGNTKSLVNRKLRSAIKKRSRLKTRLIKLNLPMT